ncbi:MAG: hypothetical protein HDT28_09320 [Clostridiales bacterium]|nr:hypothetical protein [Clostridiales bacterium]
MTKPKKKTIIIICILVAIGIVIGLLIRGQHASDFSVEQHVQRISKRVEKRFMGKDSEYTGYTVYPLYDADDKFANFCLVEFEPYGCIYIQIENSYPLLQMLGRFGMYSIASRVDEERYRYRLSKEIDLPNFADGRYWSIVYDEYGNELSYYDHYFYEVDREGQIKYCSGSHYKDIVMGDDKRYLLYPRNGFSIPAVKRGDKFFNLVSLEEFDYDPAAKVDNRYFPCIHVGSTPYHSEDL